MDTHGDSKPSPGRSPWRESLRASWVPFLASRLAVFGAAIWISASDLSPKVVEQDAYPRLSHPFGGWPAGGFFDLVLSPLVRWDALHYMAISLAGYASTDPSLPPQQTRAAFFPLYPGIVRVLSGFESSPGLVLIVSYLVSLACFLGALTLLHRLTTIELGERFARPTLMLFAFFPTAFFFGIPYTESLFVLLAIGAFLAARTGRWSGSPWRWPRRPARRASSWSCPSRSSTSTGPAPIASPARREDGDPATGPGRRGMDSAGAGGNRRLQPYQHHVLGDGLAWDHAQILFGRHTIDPLAGAWHGLHDGARSLRDLLDGSYAHGASLDEMNVGQLAFVIFAAVGGIAMLRTLPVAYGAWVLVSLLPILASQPSVDPLYSSARFIAVLFPLFMWLAPICERREWTTPVVAVSAAAMAVLTAEFALWSFVA